VIIHWIILFSVLLKYHIDIIIYLYINSYSKNRHIYTKIVVIVGLVVKEL